MFYGCSCWLWIGKDREENKPMYVFGESAIDLLVHLEAKGCFDDREIDVTERLKKKGITREDIAATIQIGECWDDAVGRVNLEPLSTWEIITLITEQIKPRYSQEKLLEIFPDEEVMFDYSWDRFMMNEDLLESHTPLILETTIITDQEKIELRSEGPEKALEDIYHAAFKRSMSDFDKASELHPILRYLHAGECRKLNISNVVLFIRAKSE